MSGADDIRAISQAALFAVRAHSDHRREDSGEPYANHLAEVASLCASLDPLDPVLVAAAWLHDIVEETDFTIDDLETLFGSEVAALVDDVSDPPELKGVARRDRQVTHTAAGSTRVKLLKLADKISNVEELIGLAPERFDLPGNKRYLKWARRVVAVCRGLASDLDARFDRAAERLDAEIAEAEIAMMAGKQARRKKKPSAKRKGKKS